MSERNNSKVNWHKGFISALEMDLWEYRSILEYRSEYKIPGSGQRIDLVLMRDPGSQLPVRNTLVQHFRRLNVFEVKGEGSSQNRHSFIKTISYACQYMDRNWDADGGYDISDLTINLLAPSMPKDLLAYFKNLGLELETIGAGICHIQDRFLRLNILSTHALQREEYTYLRSLVPDLDKQGDEATWLLSQKSEIMSQASPGILKEYMDQLYRANKWDKKKKGDTSMDPVDKLFNKFLEAGKIRQEYEQQIADSNQKALEATRKYEESEKEILRLRQLLAANGIAAG